MSPKGAGLIWKPAEAGPRQVHHCRADALPVRKDPPLQALDKSCNELVRLELLARAVPPAPQVPCCAEGWSWQCFALRLQCCIGLSPLPSYDRQGGEPSSRNNRGSLRNTSGTSKPGNPVRVKVHTGENPPKPYVQCVAKPVFPIHRDSGRALGWVA